MCTTIRFGKSQQLITHFVQASEVVNCVACVKSMLMAKHVRLLLGQIFSVRLQLESSIVSVRLADWKFGHREVENCGFPLIIEAIAKPIGNDSHPTW